MGKLRRKNIPNLGASRNQSEPMSYLACFLLVDYSLLYVFLGFLNIVGRLVDVVFNPVNHFTLNGVPEMTNWTLSLKTTLRDFTSLFYLGFHLHGEVLEHFMEVFDALLQLQDLIVPRLNLVKSLSRRFSIDQDLSTAQKMFSCFSYIFVSYKDKGSQSLI